MIEILRASLELLEQHPPIRIRGDNQSHSGHEDCAVCSYPLSGCKAEKIASHEDYVDKLSRQPCEYMSILKRLRNAIATLEGAYAREALDIAEDFENRDNITFSEAGRLGHLVRGILLEEPILAKEEDEDDEDYSEMQCEEEIWEPSEDDKKLQRYGLLFGKPRLTEEEKAEKKRLLDELKALGRNPGWEA